MDNFRMDNNSHPEGVLNGSNHEATIFNMITNLVLYESANLVSSFVAACGLSCLPSGRADFIPFKFIFSC